MARISQLNERVDIIEENIIFCQHRYNELSSKQPSFHEEADLIHNHLLSSIPSFQQILRYFIRNLRQQISTILINNIKIEQLLLEN